MTHGRIKFLSSCCSRVRLTAFIAGTIFPGLLLPGRAQVSGGGGAVSAPAAAVPASQSPGSQNTTSPAAGTTNGRSGNNNSTNNSTTNPDGRDSRTRNQADDNNNNRANTPTLRADDLTEFQQMVAATTGRPLPIFGASLFSAPPSTFAPIGDVNVGPGYIVGPGDELRLQLSGQVNQQYTVTVDRTGAISLPDVGSIHVAGVPYGQLGTYLHDQVGRIYRNFDLSVNLGSLRSIQVFVVGQARQPGTYSVSSLSTLLNAIFASGGPTPQGRQCG